MKNCGGKFARGYLIADLILSSAVLVWVVWAVWDTQWRGPFTIPSGTVLLLMLIFLLLAQQAAVLLLSTALKRRKRWMVVTASTLQILCVLPVLYVLPPLALAAGNYTPWFPLSLAAQLLFSIGGLVVQHWVR